MYHLHSGIISDPIHITTKEEVQVYKDLVTEDPNVSNANYLVILAGTAVHKGLEDTLKMEQHAQFVITVTKPVIPETDAGHY